MSTSTTMPTSVFDTPAAQNTNNLVSTPGVPGAFPKGTEAEGPNDSQPSASILSSATNNMDFQGTITSVGQTAKSYLPGSVASYFRKFICYSDTSE